MRTRVRRFRERLVLGHVRSTLADDERILSWAHAKLPGVRAPGVILVTDRRCVLHAASAQIDDRASAWIALQGWELHQITHSRAKLTLTTDEGAAISELSLTSRARAERASKLLAAISECTDLPCTRTSGPARRRRVRRRPPELKAAPRGPREHARRAVITVVGVLGLLLSAVFATPFVPGPGALTAVASIAILAREYEWARDLHVWAHRQLERFIAWIKRKKAALKGEPVEPVVETEAKVRDAA
jgi:uncharacterized protein (TIGR02611 family)